MSVTDTANQSIAALFLTMLFANHPELNVCIKTIYIYIDQGVLLAKNVDLKWKVRFKQKNKDWYHKPESL